MIISWNRLRKLHAHQEVGQGMILQQVAFTFSLFEQAGSLFQDTVGSNPFSDSHAISRLSEVTVNDLNRVEMSTYQEEDTDG